MDPYRIFAARHWQVTHRRDSRYSGYLMVSAREGKSELHELSPASLQELGAVLADAERLLRSAYAPQKVVFYKLGFSPGFAIHFHVAPVTAELLDEIRSHPGYADDPDGNDAILFLSRVYCERELDREESARMAQEIQRLRHLAEETLGVAEDV